MNEMSMKSAWPTRKICLGSTSHWGFESGVMQTLAFVMGVMQILAFLDTNMLVYPTQNSRIGGIAQHDGPMQVFTCHSGI